MVDWGKRWRLKIRDFVLMDIIIIWTATAVAARFTIIIRVILVIHHKLSTF